MPILSARRLSPLSRPRFFASFSFPFVLSLAVSFPFTLSSIAAGQQPTGEPSGTQIQKTPAVRRRPYTKQQASSSDPWWKHALIYEIYPRSYQDSNGDGVGDLNGITSRLGYLKTLGVDAIWISPMYPSPQVDFGYDISNYENVDPQYGTLADMDRLIADAKKHGIRVCLDMVLNHTSDKHQWFLDAASSRTDAKHEWYVWNDGKLADAPGVTAYQKQYEHEGRVPPNNWVSLFGGSAWEWVPAVHQFYYHNSISNSRI
jgi:alpha-glucosidase